ncbi:hypothetical protein RhiirA1_395673 [Rhizophagus irregularis]|uniref:Uncharacterized protein n=1 Tax=Rhizophagus irregularis TaxID=588596 RepID=A0A2N0RNN1_9GLOM|nr:hypothetical protein RhiirA1_395673 [Rhizophagus irregularis]
MELRKTLLAMRRAAVLTTSEFEKKNRELEEALRLGGRSLSPSTEKRELQMDDNENSTSNAISLFDHKLDQAYAEVEAEISGTSGQMGSLSRCNSLSASSVNTGNNRANFSRPPIPPGWLNLQPREKVLEQTNETTPDVPTNPRRKDSGNSESSGDNNNNVKRRSLSGRRLKRPSDGPSTPSTLSTSSTPKDENISPLERTRSLNSQPLERTRSLNSQPLERTRSIGQPLERTRSSDQHLERARAGVQLSSSRRKFGDCPRDSGYFSSGDKRRSQSSMARRGSKDITAAYHMRQSSYGRNSPDSDDAASVTSTTSEREKRALMSHHTHTRSETPTGDNVFDRLSKSQTQSSTAKKYNGERRGSVASITSVSSVTRGGVEDTLAALEGRREEYAKSPELKVQA